MPGVRNTPGVTASDERLLAHARELEERDARVASAISDIAALQLEVDELRTRASGVDAALARLPDDRSAAQQAVTEARDELARKHAEAERAAGRLAEAERTRNAERISEARRAATRARDAARMAEDKLERGEQQSAELERRALALAAEAPALERRAGELARRLEDVPRVPRDAAAEPSPGLAAAAAWGAHAHAALFVARSGLESEREAIVRQANELASSVLGEPLSATSAALVRARIRRELEHRTAPGTRAESAP